MPRVKRRHALRRGFTENERNALDMDFFNDLRGDDERRKAWFHFRDDYLVEFIEKQPFTRPSSWWDFEAPARREMADGGLHPFDDPARNRWLEEHYTAAEREPVFVLARGAPNISVGYDFHDADGNLKDGPSLVGCGIESERDYLTRLNLLVDYERRLLASGIETASV